MLKGDYGWSLIKWLLGGMFTTLFSGAGFVFITMAVEYAKECHRKRIAREIKSRKLLYGSLRRSPEEGYRGTRLSRRRNAVLTMRTNLFDAYRRSQAFLSNSYTRTKPKIDAFNEQCTPSCISGYSSDFADDYEVYESPRLTLALNSNRVGTVNGMGVMKPNLDPKHDCSTMEEERAFSQPGHVTAGNIERWIKCISHPLSMAHENLRRFGFNRKASDTNDCDRKPLTYCEECHRNLMQCAFIKSDVNPHFNMMRCMKLHSSPINSYKDCEVQTQSRGTSMNRSLVPFSSSASIFKSSHKERHLAEDKGDEGQRGRLQTRGVRRWNSCMRSEQTKRLSKGTSLGDIAKQIKGNTVTGSIASDQPAQQMIEFASTREMKRSQSHVGRFGGHNVLKCMNHANASDFDVGTDIKENIFAKEEAESKVRRNLKKSVEKSDKPIPADKVSVKSNTKLGTLSDSKVGKSSSSIKKEKPLNRHASKESQRDFSKMPGVQKVSSAHDKELNNPKGIQHRRKTGQASISETVFIPSKETGLHQDAPKLNTNIDLAIQDTGKGDYNDDKNQPALLEREQGDGYLSPVPPDEMARVPKAPTLGEHKSPPVEVGMELGTAAESNSPQSASHSADKKLNERSIAKNQKRQSLNGLHKEMSIKKAHQSLRSAEDSHKTPLTVQKKSMTNNAKLHPTNDKINGDTYKRTSAKPAMGGKAPVKRERPHSNLHETSGGSTSQVQSDRPKINTRSRSRSNARTKPTEASKPMESKTDLKMDMDDKKTTEGKKSKTYNTQHRPGSNVRTKPTHVSYSEQSKEESKKDVVTNVEVNDKKTEQRSILRMSRLDAVVREMESKKQAKQRNSVDIPEVEVVDVGQSN